MKTYNGHKNRAHWNQSLWIFNDESLYRLAQCMVSAAFDYETGARHLETAARNFIDCLDSDKTPDGVKWSVSGIKAALNDI